MLLLLLVAPVAAAPAGSATALGKLSADFLQAKIDETQGAADLTAEERDKLIDLYRRAITQLQTAEAQRAAAEEFKKASETAPATTAKIRAELEKKGTRSVETGVREDAPLAELEAALLKEQANYAALDTKLATLESQLSAEGERPGAVRTRLAEANQMLAEIAAEVERGAPTATPEDLARGWLRQARQAALGAEVRALDQELLSQPVRLDLLNAERDLTALTVERSEARLRDLDAMVLEKRRLETEQATADAEAEMRDVADKHVLVQALAERNAELTAEIADLTARLERASRDEKSAREQQTRVEEEFRAAKQKLEVAGLSQALGMVLQEQRRALPDITATRKQVAAREQEIAEIALTQIQHREERRTLRSLSGYVGAEIERLPDAVAATVDETVEDQAEDLARKRRKLLDQALDLDRAYLRSLGDLDFVQRGLMATVSAFDQYLAGRLLWIRTAPALTLEDVVAIPREVLSILSPRRWAEVGEILLEQLIRAPTFAVGLAAFVGLWWSRRRLKAALRETSVSVGMPTRDELGSTLRALVLTLLIAAPFPFLLALLAWQLGAAPKATEFARAVATSAGWILRPLALLEFFRCMCVAGGLAESHFGWLAVTRRAIRRQLTRLMAGFLSFGFLVSLLVNFKQVAFTGGLGRLALLGTLVAVGFFAHGMLHPKTGALRAHLGDESAGILSRLRGLWVPLAFAVLVTLGGLTIAGYFYAAAALVFRSVLTVALAFGVILVHELVVRWMTLTHRRLAYRAAVERREAARLAREHADRLDAVGVEPPPAADEETPVDFAALGEEAKRLLDALLWILAVVGLWVVWWNVLPALDVLDEIPLWTKSAFLHGEETVVPVSVADVAFAILLAIVTIVGTRRLPAVLQFAVLERLDVSAGSQYAISTLSRYALGAIGFIVVTNAIGLDWSQVQWLVAALGVGIGFGLQEIVANFISGLIILFERPVRVGDVVTVGDTDGVVTRIRIRATTIRTWDRKELLVPNKEFVTGRLLNWSLSDQVSRISVPVDVAYGSDVGKAMALMTEAAKEHPRVMAEPPPFAIFEAFGDNALALRLRCYVDSLDFRLPTISELHEDIDRRFRTAGIEIAFPQRDLHLRSAQPIDVRLHPAGGGNPEGS